MAKLPEALRIIAKGFPGLDKVLEPLNKFTRDVSLLLNKRLTVAENMDGDVLTVLVEGSFPISVPWTRKTPPSIVIIGQCRRSVTPHVPLTSPISLDWEFLNGQIQINGVPGLVTSLSPDERYKLTLLALVG